MLSKHPLRGYICQALSLLVYQQELNYSLLLRVAFGSNCFPWHHLERRGQTRAAGHVCTASLVMHCSCCYISQQSAKHYAAHTELKTKGMMYA